MNRMKNRSALIMRVMRRFCIANGDRIEFKIDILNESSADGRVRRRIISEIKRLEKNVETWEQNGCKRNYKSEGRRETARQRLKCLRKQLRTQEDNCVSVNVNICDGIVYRELGMSSAFIV